MLIGELSARTGESTRSLRYWESQSLLAPRRDGRGYRSYEIEAVQTVGQVRALLDAGLSTQEIWLLLPCARGQGPTFELCDDVEGFLRDHAARIDRDLERLRRRRRSVAGFLDGAGLR